MAAGGPRPRRGSRAGSLAGSGALWESGGVCNVVDVLNLDIEISMGTSTFLGEFEHLVMLAVMQLADDAHAIRVREQIEGRARRSVARGALYGTLTRLQEKGFLDWQVEESTPKRGGIPRRRFTVTTVGVEALRNSQRAIANLSEGLERALEG